MSRPISCVAGTISPEDSSSEGCPITTKRRIVSIDKGQTARICWPMRWRDGQAADLSDCFYPLGSESAGHASTSESFDADSESAADGDGDLVLKVRFRDACGSADEYPTVVAAVADAVNGLACFTIPKQVAQNSGVYGFQIGIFEDADLLFVDSGVINVEAGLWGNTDQRTGPPTLEEIRYHLRDRAAENTLLRQVEFDDSELLMAISRPIAQFNETPPPICNFSCRNFPFKYHWLNAIVAELLRVSAHHYMRNCLQVNSGGLSIDDKNRYTQYLKYADMYIEEWKNFIIEKKVQINAEAFSGSSGSSYGYHGM